MRTPLTRTTNIISVARCVINHMRNYLQMWFINRSAVLNSHLVDAIDSPSSFQLYFMLIWVFNLDAGIHAHLLQAAICIGSYSLSDQCKITCCWRNHTNWMWCDDAFKYFPSSFLFVCHQSVMNCQDLELWCNTFWGVNGPFYRWKFYALNI